MRTTRLAAATLAGYLATAATAMAASFTFAPDAISVDQGETFTVEAQFSSMPAPGGAEPGLIGFGFNLDFDPTKLSFIGAAFSAHDWFMTSPGSPPPPGGPYDDLEWFNITAGIDTFTMNPGQPVTGTDVTVATLTFMATAPGRATISFPDNGNLAMLADFSMIAPANAPTVEVTIAPTGVIPLPATLPLLLAGLGGLAALRRR